MKQVFAVLVLVTFVTAIGCNNKKGATQPAAANAAVTDITPTQTTPAAAPSPAYTPAPAATYTPASPLVSDVTTTPVAGGSSYTVKKGDTLFAIAKSHYGPTGVSRNVDKIVAANPGLSAANLKAGQTISIP